jgi:hypothetical protein
MSNSSTKPVYTFRTLCDAQAVYACHFRYVETCLLLGILDGQVSDHMEMEKSFGGTRLESCFWSITTSADLRVHFDMWDIHFLPSEMSALEVA